MPGPHRIDDSLASAGGTSWREVRRRLWLPFVIPGILLPVVVEMRAALGPYWLRPNVDPTYAYLTNSLLLATGHAARHTDNPGTPVQLLGAVTIRLTHLVAGRTGLEMDVLARPEMYLAAIQVTLVGAFLMTLAVCGAVILRATGSPAMALLLQLSPFLTVRPMTDLTKVKPEPLLMTIVTLLVTVIALCVFAPAAVEGRRRVAALGLLCGVGMATKVTLLPLVVVPLAVLRSWTQRLAYLAVTTAVFFAITVPATVSVGKFFRFITRYATHTRAYGRGEEAIVPPDLVSTRLPALFGKLAREEWVFLGLLAVGLAFALAAFVRRRVGAAGTASRTAWFVLALLLLAEGGSLLLVTKNPGVPERYLVPAFAMVGLLPLLLRELMRAGSPAFGSSVRRGAGLVLAAAAGLHFIVGVRSDIRSMSRDRDKALRRRAEASAAAAAVPCSFVLTSRASAPEAALYFGDQFAGRAFGATLDRLYPGTLLISAPNPHFVTFAGRVPVREALARGDLCALDSEGTSGWPEGIAGRPVAGSNGLLAHLEDAGAAAPAGQR